MFQKRNSHAIWPRIGRPNTLPSTAFVASRAVAGQSVSLRLRSLATYASRLIVTLLTAYSWYLRLEVWA